MTMVMEMSFYCTREADGTIHVQNAVMGWRWPRPIASSREFPEVNDEAGIASRFR